MCAAGARRNIGAGDAERVHVVEVGARVALDHLHRLDALAARALQDAILAAVEQVADIGDVLHVAHAIAAEAQVAHDHVERDVGLGVADVRVVVDRRAADVHRHLAVRPWV